MSLRAFFRLPGNDRAYSVGGEWTVVPDGVAGVGRESGFVLAPFSPSRNMPVLLLPARACQPFDLSETDDADASVPPFHAPHAATDEERYARQFDLYHEPLRSGQFQKLVLSRRKRLDFCEAIRLRPAQHLYRWLFRRACRQYPDAFVALVETDGHGAWLTATPEVLLRAVAGHRYHTMALAGTMPYTEEPAWSQKNRDEQQYVADYIGRCLQACADDIEQSPTRTVRAGHLAHLRTDFHFALHGPEQFGRLLDALHPTPAVCGLPKQEAYAFLREHAASERQYYSGFLGPVSLRPDDSSEDLTALYVNLRCMQLSPAGISLYAGGGLLAESREHDEFLETEAKMLTMLRLLEPSCTAEETVKGLNL